MLEQRLAVRRVDDLGVELHARGSAGSTSSIAATGASGVVAGDRRTRRARSVMESKWLIHTCWCGGLAVAEQHGAGR